MSDASLVQMVDVVIPIYNAPDDLARCVESVLAHTPQPHRLVLIDDASRDPGVAQYLDRLSQRGLSHVECLRNPRNLGFTGTANRGMQLSRNDVVLLNSDTVVTHGWLEALLRCARSDPTIGTITPFSNNAEICSYPRFCENNPWDGSDPEPVRRALAMAAVPTYPELPTGVGFCLFVRRALLDSTGGFDPAFGRGYGEENDLCLRAVGAGFRNVLCDDAYVLHVGGRSFAGEKTTLGATNMQVLLARHPQYEAMVHEYIAADPLRPIREAALSRYRARDGRPGVLHVVHGQGGGTERYARALITASRQRYRHALVFAVGETWTLEEHGDDGVVRAFQFTREPGETWLQFVRGLCSTFDISLLHVHNISGCRTGLIDALSMLDVPFGYTVHDLNFACPTITLTAANGMYCGSQTDAGACGRCLEEQPAFATIDIAEWRFQHRRVLDHASFLMAPSHWAAQQLQRYFPGHAVSVVPHGIQRPEISPRVTPADRPPRMAILLPDDGTPTVAVLGAVGPDKGARRLERMAEAARESGARLRFVLIGYLDREHGPWQSADAVLTIHGHYQPRDLPDLLAHYRTRLVCFPSAGPETFSFTLSEAWQAGRPALVPPFGALAERVRAHGGGWVWSEEEWLSEEKMLARLVQLLADPVEIARVASRVRGIAPITLEVMAERTIKLYERSFATARPAAALPFDAARVRDALGYRPWFAPRNGLVAVAQGSEVAIDDAVRTDSPAPPVAASGALSARIARLALRMRRTPLGRVLHQVTPGPIVDALKSRLR